MYQVREKKWYKMCMEALQNPQNIVIQIRHSCRDDQFSSALEGAKCLSVSLKEEESNECFHQCAFG